MRLGSFASVCAVSALAMVFSVQQGEHGPLVVYKLKLPKPVERVAPTPAPQAAPAVNLGRLVKPHLPPAATRPAAAPQPARAPQPKAPRLGPLEPTILGTVVMPAKRRAAVVATPASPAPIPLLPQATTEAPAAPEFIGFSLLYHPEESSAPIEGGVLVNENTGENLTLEEVNDAITWRRDTVGRLRQLPLGPRF